MAKTVAHDGIAPDLRAIARALEDGVKPAEVFDLVQAALGWAEAAERGELRYIARAAPGGFRVCVRLASEGRTCGRCEACRASRAGFGV